VIKALKWPSKLQITQRVKIYSETKVTS